MIEVKQTDTFEMKIVVAGIGGGGCNAVRAMLQSPPPSLSFLLLDSNLSPRDEPPLKAILMGQEITRGLGAGGDVELGEQVTRASTDEITKHLQGASMVFISAGLGGGIGTGGAPVVAALAKSMGVLTVGLATLPFAREGKKRMTSALKGLAAFKSTVDSMILLSNDRLIEQAKGRVSIIDAFRPANDVLNQAVSGIVETIETSGAINLDFADIRAVMSHQGMAIMGMGVGTGPDRVQDALKEATESPLLKNRDISQAMGILVNLVASAATLTLEEYHQTLGYFETQVGGEVEIIGGWAIDETMEETLKITVLAAGLRDASF